MLSPSHVQEQASSSNSTKYMSNNAHAEGQTVQNVDPLIKTEFVDCYIPDIKPGLDDHLQNERKPFESGIHEDILEMDDDNKKDVNLMENCTPPEITATAKTAALILLPEKSKKSYEIAYKSFMDWRAGKNANSFSQDILLAYFTELALKYKSSSLWTIYSMLKATLNIHHNINIENYPKLVSFLKGKTEGYKTKKAAVFTPNEVREFIAKAPDNKYLATKVALIMGIMGRCRTNELYQLKVQNVHDDKTAFLVDILDTKNKVDRQFPIRGPFYNIVKKYIYLRSPTTRTDYFFMNFQNGKCTIQPIGINKFRSFGKQIATYLKLPSPEKYTGRSLRKSSAAIYTDGGANLMNSLNVKNNSNISNAISNNLGMNSTPCINLSNCNVTINFHSK